MIDFPASPTVGQQFTAAGVTWTWDGVKWGLTAAGGAPITVGDTAPSSPAIGALWYDSVGGQMYVWYNDGNSSQWVPVVNQGYAASSAPLIVRPPVAASWTQRNFGGSTTLTNVANGTAFYDVSTAAVSNVFRAITIAAPAAPYTIDVNVLAQPYLIIGAAATQFIGGLGWTDGTKIQAQFNYVVNTATTFAVVSEMSVSDFANYTASVTANHGSVAGIFNTSNLWLRIADDGTNVTFWSSADGVVFMQNYTVAKASGYLGASGDTNVGLFLDSGQLGNGGSANMTIKSWWVR